MHEYKAKVTKVIDGDTIRCDIDLGFDIVMTNQTIRLYGIDTPESRTKDLEDVLKKADIIVAAIGRAHFVKKEMVKEGAVVIDVGINRLDTGKLAGDVDFDAVKEISSFITPVPGGVGPMTITMLLWNTLTSLEKSIS